METAKLWIVIQSRSGSPNRTQINNVWVGRGNDIPSINEIYVHRISNELARIIITIIAACLPRIWSQ